MQGERLFDDSERVEGMKILHTSASGVRRPKPRQDEQIPMECEEKYGRKTMQRTIKWQLCEKRIGAPLASPDDSGSLKAL